MNDDWGHYHASGYSYNDPIVAILIVLDTQTIEQRMVVWYVCVTASYIVGLVVTQPDRWSMTATLIT